MLGTTQEKFCEVKKMDDYITVTCVKCEKILFEGTKKQAKRLIIYCVECSQIP